MNGNTMWLVIAVFIIYIAFVFILQNKRRQEYNIQQSKREEFKKNLKKGDYVVTMSGIYGYIRDIKDNKVSLEISNNVLATMDIEALMGTLNK